MQAYEDGDLSPEHVSEIAERLDVNEDEVISMNRRMSGADQSLNAPLRMDGEGEWQDWLVDDAPGQEAQLAETDEFDKRRELLTKAMSGLNDRERDIIVKRRLSEEPSTLEDLSQIYNVSRERIRQIEVRAFEKLQDAMKTAAVEQNLITAH